MRLHYAIGLTVCMMVIGCVGLNTTLPQITLDQIEAEQIWQEQQAFKEMDRLRARLDKVAFRVLAANQDLCEKTTLDVGVQTLTLDAFPKELKKAAQRELGLGDEPMIVFVRPGSDAEAAGLKPGDQLFNTVGDPLGVPGKAFKKAMERNEDIILQRGSQRETIKLSGQRVCDYPVRLKMSAEINAYANGRSITMMAGMMNFVISDEELAYIIGHELAHNTEDHVRKSIFNYVISFGGTRFTRPFEAEADYVGLYFMERAGYDSSNIEDFWRRLALQSVRPIGRAKTHPTFPDRFVRLRAARAEIRDKQSKNEKLVPEPNP